MLVPFQIVVAAVHQWDVFKASNVWGDSFMLCYEGSLIDLGVTHVTSK